MNYFRTCPLNSVWLSALPFASQCPHTVFNAVCGDAWRSTERGAEVASNFHSRTWYWGVQTVWGQEDVPEKAPSRKLSGPFQKSFWPAQSWILVHETQSNDTREGRKAYQTKVDQESFWGGVPFVRWFWKQTKVGVSFSVARIPPPTTPHGVLWQLLSSTSHRPWWPEPHKTCHPLHPMVMCAVL